MGLMWMGSGLETTYHMITRPDPVFRYTVRKERYQLLNNIQKTGALLVG